MASGPIGATGTPKYKAQHACPRRAGPPCALASAFASVAHCTELPTSPQPVTLCPVRKSAHHTTRNGVWVTGWSVAGAEAVVGCRLQV